MGKNTTETSYPRFSPIPRLFKDTVITEKIDGTNGMIEILECGTVRAGSRTRYVKIGDDNYGFAGWVKQNEDELRDFLGPGRHYGEWFGQKIQRTYGLTERRFALFNTRRWFDPRSTPSGSNACPPCCTVVPVLYNGVFEHSAIDKALDRLKREGSVLVPGFKNPEGIVVFHTASQGLYKVTLDNNDAHKGLHLAA